MVFEAKFYSAMQNNVGQNVGDRLNFVTCEQTWKVFVGINIKDNKRTVIVNIESFNGRLFSQVCVCSLEGGGGVYPQIQDREYPLQIGRGDMGYPPPAGYAAGGTPLAVTQQNFLVCLVYFTSRALCPARTSGVDLFHM